MPKRSSLAVIFVGILALAGIIQITKLVTRLRKPDPISQPIVTPPQNPFPISIGARGLVESLDENIRIAPAISGRIDKVFVKVGSRVQKGDPLFEIDAREAASNVVLEEKQLEVLAARLKEAEVLVEDRQKQVTRSNTLLERKAGSEDLAERNQFALLAAKTALSSALANYHHGIAMVEKAKVTLDIHTVRAPRNARVLQVSIREGEFANTATESSLMLLGDTDRLQIRADVDEDSASRIRANVPAVAYLKGMRSAPIPLEFVRIEPYILPKRSLTGESTERVDTRVLQVIFQFSPPAFPVYPGQQMDVFIEDQSAASGTQNPNLVLPK